MDLTSAYKTARAAFESLYEGTCTVTEHSRVKNTDGSSGFVDNVIYTDQPCRLSYSSTGTSDVTADDAASVTQRIKLFTSPELAINAGSKISVVQNGNTVEFKSSGVPAIYATHQEIDLVIFKGWA